MELLDIYNQVTNPLAEPSIIGKFIDAYAEGGNLYNKLTRTVKKDNVGTVRTSHRDAFHSMMFNKWKKNVVEMTRDRFIKLRNSGSFGDDFVKMRNFLKNVSDVATMEEAHNILHRNKDKEIDAAFEKYSWDAIGMGSGWNHVCSRYVTAKKDEFPKVEHRLYLNTESLDTYLLAILFVQKCGQHQLPYYFKYDEYGNRDDTFVIYSDTENLPNYIKVLKEIKDEQPDLVARFKTPPILTGKIDGWIGYGTEPSKTPEGKNQSFNTVRSKVIEKAIDRRTTDWIMAHRNATINYQSQEMPIFDYIAAKITEKYIKELKRKFAPMESRGQTDAYFANKYGVIPQDLNSATFKKNICQALIKSIDNSSNNLSREKGQNFSKVIIPARNKNEIVFFPSSFKETIRPLASWIAAHDPTFIADIKKAIVEESKKVGIDVDKYCFDMRISKNLKQQTTEKGGPKPEQKTSPLPAPIPKPVPISDPKPIVKPMMPKNASLVGGFPQDVAEALKAAKLRITDGSKSEWDKFAGKIYDGIDGLGLVEVKPLVQDTENNEKKYPVDSMPLDAVSELIKACLEEDEEKPLKVSLEATEDNKRIVKFKYNGQKIRYDFTDTDQFDNVFLPEIMQSMASIKSCAQIQTEDTYMLKSDQKDVIEMTGFSKDIINNITAKHGNLGVVAPIKSA